MSKLILPSENLLAGTVYMLATKGSPAGIVFATGGDPYVVTPFAERTDWSIALVTPTANMPAMAVYKQALLSGAPSNGVALVKLDSDPSTWQAVVSAPSFGQGLDACVPAVLAELMSAQAGTDSKWLGKYGIVIAASAIVVGLIWILYASVKA